MKRFKKQNIAINGLGALGYLILLLTWTLFASVVIMGLMNASVISVPILEPVQVDTNRPDPSGALTVSTYVITGLAVIASAAVVIMLPYLVGRWGSRLVRTILTLTKTTPAHRTLFSVKLVLVLIASVGMFTASFFLPPENTEIYAVQLLGSVCAVLSIALFAIQHWLARHAKVAIEKVW